MPHTPSNLESVVRLLSRDTPEGFLNWHCPDNKILHINAHGEIGYLASHVIFRIDGFPVMGMANIELGTGLPSHLVRSRKKLTPKMKAAFIGLLEEVSKTKVDELPWNFEWHQTEPFRTAFQIARDEEQRLLGPLRGAVNL